MDAELKRLLERGVDALEKLSDDPVIDVPVKPPVCPYCDRMNPTIKVRESEATGPMAEFVILAECQSCRQHFYTVPEGWNVFKMDDHDVLRQFIEERAELGNYGNDGRKDQGT